MVLCGIVGCVVLCVVCYFRCWSPLFDLRGIAWCCVVLWDVWCCVLRGISVVGPRCLICVALRGVAWRCVALRGVAWCGVLCGVVCCVVFPLLVPVV